MIRSMTGYARVKRSSAAGELTLSLKSVNHRTLDLHFNLPAALEEMEQAMRAIARRTLTRGHVELRLQWDQPRASDSALNRSLLERYVAAFREASAEYTAAGALDINAALQLPGMFGDVAVTAAKPAEAELVALAEDGCRELNLFREREGQELAADMRARYQNISLAVAQLETLRSAAAQAVGDRLRSRLNELLLKVDPQRLAQEVALLVERSDIAEEISRLAIHVRQLGLLLDGGGEVGKKLDFLLQEMNRETNTMLAKTANAGEPGVAVSTIALAIKADIEKIREQSLNVE